MKKTLLAAAVVASMSFAAFANEAVLAELVDGTKVEIAGDVVSVLDKDGNKMPAPKGEHELKEALADGTKKVVVDEHGKIVKK